MMRSVICFLIAVIGISCSSKKSGWEVNDGDLTVQLMNADSKDNTSGTRDYKLRIYLATGLSESINYEVKSAMWYKMDSCIYLQAGDEKVYPLALEPISNGIKNSFEYLLLFDESLKGDDLKFVYQDRHLNKKTYSFNLNK